MDSPVRIRLRSRPLQHLPIPHHRRNLGAHCKLLNHSPHKKNTRNNPVTNTQQFNVMGMAKVVGNLSIGWLIAGRLPTFIEVAGVMLAMSGTWLYATANNTAKKAGEVEREGLLAEDTRDIGLDQLYPFREEEESAGEGEGEERAGDVKVAERAGDVKAEGRVELPDPNMFTEGGKEDDLLISEPVLSR